MEISANVRSAGVAHEVKVSTSGVVKPLAVAAKDGAPGSAINGGEFLMLALATCYCNDLYREAARLGISVEAVEVEASAEFAGVGLAASDVRYRARVDSPASPERIAQLLRETDAVAEVQNTVRAGVGVTLVPWSARDGLAARARPGFSPLCLRGPRSRGSRASRAVGRSVSLSEPRARTRVVWRASMGGGSREAETGVRRT